MAGQSLFVTPEGLNAGAERCNDAATSASSGARTLQEITMDAGIFGDFGEAHGFHALAAQVHAHHVEKFAAHRDRLSGLSGKGQDASKAFTGADAASAEAIDRLMHLGD
ncbi:DUF2563 family protein [Mycobacterium sp. SMC-18]|uniref:DUF2563 family protein n=1 Tax=Mycobacterium sp. SMC-18 TaxID=3381629 RepID=UPI0038775099